jgi:hypothetical protein
MDMHDPMTGEIVEPVSLGMPPALAAAIIAVKKGVKQLGVDDRNQHGGYNFVSVDKFYERIGKLMAEAGLALLIDETSTEVRTSERQRDDGKTPAPWLFTHYDCRFMHESGALSPPMRRSCALPISGPQAFGAAQSYIEKQLLRQIFKVPTGEKDADETEPRDQDAPAGASGVRTASEAPARTQTTHQRQQAAPAPSDAVAALIAEVNKRLAELRGAIDASMTVRDAEMVFGCPAWEALESKIVETEMKKNATPEAAATIARGVMERLKVRVDNRVEMLLRPEGYAA